MLILISCSEADAPLTELSDESLELELVSPNGYVLAESVTVLKNIISPELSRHIGNHDFRITRIEYLESKGEVAAVIHYDVKEIGVYSSLILSTSSGKTESNASACSYTLRCSGDACCGIYGSIYPSTGEITYNCGCSDCTLEITPVTDCER